MSRTIHAKTRRTRIGTALIAGASALLLAACAGSPAAQEGDKPSSGAPADLTDVTLTLNFLAGGPNSGFMVAKEKGYYEDAGLNVKIQEGQGSGSTASLVAQGNSEFGVADGPSAMTVASQGGDLVNVGQILQTNGFSTMSLKDKGIEEVKDLEGKSVGVQPGTAQASLFDALLAANGVDKSTVNIVNIDPSALVGSLLQGSVDAITAGADSQGVQLKDQGAEINEIMYRDAGVPTVGLSMITGRSYAEENPKIVSAFVEASLKGWDDARNDPAEASEIVAKQFPQGADPEAIEKQLAVDIELLCSKGSEGLGKVAPETWQETYDLIVEYLDLPTDEPVDFYYTNDYLPKDLPEC
ncbi:MAG: ABC transporter substrate-binding protein [Mycetocola sp.]